MLKVEQFLTDNPDLQKEFELLKQTIFLPEEIIYDQKELLLHKEEKRRLIPLYWVRIAASVFFLISAGWLILTNVPTNHKGAIAEKNRHAEKVGPVTDKQVPENKDFKINDQTDRSAKRDITENHGQVNLSAEKGISKSIDESSQNRVKKLNGKYNSGEIKNNPNSLIQSTDANSQIVDVGGESFEVVQKSNATLEIQPGRLHTETDLKRVDALAGARTSALVLITAGSVDQLKNEKSDLKEQNFQTDNAIQTDDAISVVALNDQNKAITSFFKKFTRQNPEDNKTNNARTMRVSVFQINY
jgi:hypothetical protein